jgi:hypothetical protein
MPASMRRKPRKAIPKPKLRIVPAGQRPPILSYRERRDFLRAELARRKRTSVAISLDDTEKRPHIWFGRTSAHVETITKLDLDDVLGVLSCWGEDGSDRSYIPGKAQTYKVYLSYPLSEVVEVTVPPYEVIRKGRKRQRLTSVPYLLWQTARAYREVYRQWKKYGIWGHAIGDLWFEGFEIREDGVTLMMGS